MKLRMHLVAAGWLAIAGFSLMTSNPALAVSPAVQDPGKVVTPSAATSATGSFDNVMSAEDYAALMEREAARWEGPANVDKGRVPGSAVSD